MSADWSLQSPVPHQNIIKMKTYSIKPKAMKSYTIDYLPSLSSFLDEKDIIWYGNVDNYTVTFELENDQQFTNLIMDYEEWLENIDKEIDL